MCYLHISGHPLPALNCLYVCLEIFGCPESYASTIMTMEIVPLTLISGQHTHFLSTLSILNTHPPSLSCLLLSSLPTICVLDSPRVSQSPSASWLEDPLSSPPASESWTPPRPFDPVAPPWLLAPSSPPWPVSPPAPLGSLVPPARQTSHFFLWRGVALSGRGAICHTHGLFVVFSFSMCSV